MDLLHLCPGVATCSNCGARFSYNVVGFRIFLAGMTGFVLLSLLALSTDPLEGHPLRIALACFLSVVVGAFALPLGGLEVVD